MIGCLDEVGRIGDEYGRFLNGRNLLRKERDLVLAIMEGLG